MITVGLVKELYFISTVLKTEVQISLTADINPTPVILKVKNNLLDVWYLDTHIWHEKIEGPTAFFGFESCDAISRCIACLNNKDIAGARKYFYHEKTDLTSQPNPS